VRYLILIKSLTVIFLSLLAVLMGSSVIANELGCAATAQTLRLACDFDVRDSFLTGAASCMDQLDTESVDECMAEVQEERTEDSEECTDVLEGRMDLCSSLDNKAHEPEFGEDFADNFVDPMDIGGDVPANPFLPLVQGKTWTYEGTSTDDDGEEETETVIVTVTDRVKKIEGILCLVVNDISVEEDIIVESTDDWFAQDVNGNVWYCGEIAENFEVFDGDEPEDPELVDIEGSWKSGRDGAKAGMLLPFEPMVGTFLRTELAYTDAEDAIEIVDTQGTESAAAASCDGNCLVTQDFSPLDPGVTESKYYLPGVGLILEIDNETGDRLELVEYD